MKKVLISFSCILFLIILCGCTMDNTPTKKVENFLDNYQKLDDNVLAQLKNMVDTDTLMNDEQRTIYTDVMKHQYQDLKYKIKDEKIDGDTATVTTEIEVYDYYKTTTDAEEYYNANQKEFYTDGVLDNAKYVAYRIGKLKDTKDKVKYTIDFTLTKVDNNWVLNDIDDTTRQKIHGLYAH